MNNYVYKIISGFFILMCLSLYASEDSIVKGASYYVYDQNAKELYATFYTFDGEPIKKVEYRPGSFKCMLDPSAPKPRPVKYKLYSDIVHPPGRWRGGIRRYYILFLDNKGNHIVCFPYAGDTSKTLTAEDLIPFSEKIDLTLVNHYSYDPKDQIFRDIW